MVQVEKAASHDWKELKETPKHSLTGSLVIHTEQASEGWRLSSYWEYRFVHLVHAGHDFNFML